MPRMPVGLRREAPGCLREAGIVSLRDKRWQGIAASANEKAAVKTLMRLVEKTDGY